MNNRLLDEAGVSYTFEEKEKVEGMILYEYYWFYIPTTERGSKSVYVFSLDDFVKLLRSWNRMDYRYIYYVK